VITPGDLARWQLAVDAIVGTTPWLRSGVALDTCGSTQDECRARSAGTPGCLVTSLTQTRGRGRPGKTWDHDALAGLAVTVSIAPEHAASASIAAGLAAARAAVLHTDGPASALLGVKWPNDVVRRDPQPQSGPASGALLQKLGGVLVESADGILLVGIGLNVRTPGVAVPGRTSIEAVSSHDAAPPERLAVLATLVDQLTMHLAMSQDELRSGWALADRLVGLRRGFVCDGHEYLGTVLALDPFDRIRLELDSGRVVSLPLRITTPLDAYSGPS